MEQQHLPRQGHSQRPEMPSLGGAGGGKASSQQEPPAGRQRQKREKSRRWWPSPSLALPCSGLAAVCTPTSPYSASAVQRNYLWGQRCSTPALSQRAATGHMLLSTWNMASTMERQSISFYSTEINLHLNSHVPSIHCTGQHHFNLPKPQCPHEGDESPHTPG